MTPPPEATRTADGPSTLIAPAKLTTELRITGVRGDGYHLIDAEMVSLDLADRLVVHPGVAGIAVDGPFASSVPTDGSNLIARALELAGRTARVEVDKRIPPGGGLGGGSTDAAAVLRWAGFTDLVAASRLGADIPFCLIGGRARVGGIGEIVRPLPPRPLHVTLVVPPLAMSTPAVYRAWDELGGPTADGPNDLEPAALSVEPRLRRWRDRIGELCGSTPLLAGSGATWWVAGHHEDALAELVDEGVTVIGATTVAQS